ncbi:MAG: hypothetical protein ABL997_03200 [Planctomycetota bacterium]
MLRLSSAIVLLAATAVAQDHIFTLGFANATGPSGLTPSSHPSARVKDNDLDGFIQVPTELHTFLSTCYHTTAGTCFMTDVRAVVSNGEYEFFFTDSEQGRVIRGVDRNHNGLLDRLEDVNGNGVLDVGEDTNSNLVLDTEVSEFFYFGVRTAVGSTSLLAPDTLGVYRDPISNQTRAYVSIDNPSNLGYARGIHKLVDLNNDGDAKDAGEFSLFVNSTIALTTPGLGTPLPNFWQQVRILPGGKIIGFASGLTYTAASTLSNENCFYGFTDNGGPTPASVEIFFNCSTLNLLPRHPDFQSGTFPVMDIDYLNGVTPTRRSFARWLAVSEAGGTAGVVPAYYFANSYTWGTTQAPPSFGDINVNAEHISGLVFRVNDLNNNQVIDAGELGLWANMSGATIAGVPAATFTNAQSSVTINTLIDRTWSVDATRDGEFNFVYANGGGADAVVAIRDLSFDDVIQTGEINMTYFTSAPGGVFPPPFNPSLGPFFSNGHASLTDGTMPGPFGAGLAVTGEGCLLPGTGYNTLMDAWGGSPSQGNTAFKVGAIRGIPFFPAIMTIEAALLPVPFPLAGVGFPAGCQLYTPNPQVYGFTFADGLGRSIFGAGIPVNPGLIGQTAIFQGAVLDPSSPVSLQWHTTNALLVTIQP